MPRHSLTRCLNRRLRRPLARRCSRRTVRRVGRGPRVNHLAQALSAFNRAVRARCRLARLAPEIFDSAVVRRREEEREDRRQLMAELEPIIQKVYGPDAGSPPEELHHAQTDEWCRNGAEMVQFSSGKVQKIETILAERELWMTLGAVALARHQNLQPHRPGRVFFSPGSDPPTNVRTGSMPFGLAVENRVENIGLVVACRRLA